MAPSPSFCWIFLSLGETVIEHEYLSDKFDSYIYCLSGATISGGEWDMGRDRELNYDRVRCSLNPYSSEFRFHVKCQIDINPLI